MRGRVTQNGSNSGSGDSGRDGKGAGLMGMVAGRSDSGTWEPTSVYLILLVLLEFATLILLRYAFSKVHAG